MNDPQTLRTVWGNLPYEHGLRDQRCVTADDFDAALKSRAQTAWAMGDGPFIYTHAMALADGVVA